MIYVKIKKERDNFIPFKKATKDSACFDVYASEIIESDDIVTVKLGFSTEIPNEYKGVIVPRSNITKYGFSMLNSPGQIDSDYRGEWIIKFQRLSSDSYFPYKVGERCCQIYFDKIHEVEFSIADSLSETERGVGGFGHTGK